VYMFAFSSCIYLKFQESFSIVHLIKKRKYLFVFNFLLSLLLNFSLLYAQEKNPGKRNSILQTILYTATLINFYGALLYLYICTENKNIHSR
jgi:hypothetical protein